MLRKDATVTCDVMRKLLNDETKDVVLVMHSYGGISGSEAVAMVKRWLDVYGQPDHGKVRRLVYLAAHVVEKGEALMGGGRTLNVANFNITEVRMITIVIPSLLCCCWMRDTNHLNRKAWSPTKHPTTATTPTQPRKPPNQPSISSNPWHTRP